MPGRFKWVPEIERGQWLRPMEAEQWGSILSIVPRGFEMYARIFHPVERDRPYVTKSWLGLDEQTYFEDVQDIDAVLETEHATWAQVAASFGTTMHAQAQYARLLRRDYGDAGGAISADGWRYGDTNEGSFDAASLAATAGVLARHTTTADAGIAAIWEGWGGLVSSAGIGDFFSETGEGMPARYTDRDPAKIADPSLRGRFAASAQRTFGWMRSTSQVIPGLSPATPKLGSGLLPVEIAAGPRFELHAGTGRSYVLFEAGANDFADAAWPGRAPWTDGALWAQSPSILWPDDHSWVLATEIDFDSTLVAGTAALIHELIQTPGLEVLPIGTDADLSSEGDLVNRPD